MKNAMPNGETRGGVVLNIDDAHFLLTRGPDEMTVDGCRALVDSYAGTSVRALVFCAVGKRIAAPVDAAEWERLDSAAAARRAAGTPLTRSEVNHLSLLDSGIDPFRIWIDRARFHGIGAWLGVRMNDDHHYFNEDSPSHPAWWREHPELRRRNYAFDRNCDRAYDYRFPQVRDRIVRCISALLDRYEPDGIELDWMRRTWHFAPGHEREGAAAATDVMRRVRALCRANGRAVKVSVRVPPTPWDCEGFGLDAVAWAREGLVDGVAPSPDMCVYDELPVEIWKQLLDGTGAVLAPGVVSVLRATRERPHLKNGERRTVGPEALAGLAAQFFERGADMIHAFNLFDRSNALGEGAHRGIISVLGDADALASVPRRHIATYDDCTAPGQARLARLPVACGPCGNGSPWSDLSVPDTAEIRMHVGKVPQGACSEIRLAFTGCSRRDGNVWDGQLTPAAAASVYLNGARCVFAGPCDGVAEPTPDEDLWRYAIPDGALLDGHNLIEVISPRCGVIEWSEIAIFRKETERC